MKFLYDFIAGNSRVTPFGVIGAALIAALLVRAHLNVYGGLVFLAALFATLVGGVMEKER